MKWLAVVALATAARALPEMFLGRRREGFTSHLHENMEIDPSLLATGDIGVKRVTQKLDHFDSSNLKTWDQRYFFNHKYSTEDSNTNILYLNGEGVGQLVTIAFEVIPYVYYAKELNADLYSLEHRFYGESRPTEDMSVENLKFLSSRQAIEDIAEFIRQINKEKGGDQKWIVVGGSYAGALSAWSRLKHPELIAGALASSGPILAQMDFYGYLQTVDENFKKIGGLCYQQISAGLETAQKLFQTKEGWQKLTSIFKLNPPIAFFDDLSPLDIDTFFSNLISPFEQASQYSSPHTINELCEIFTANGPDYDPLQAFKDILPKIPVFMDINFADSVADLSVTKFKGLGFRSSTRPWIYQTCAEFGYFQSTNQGSNVFGQTQSSNSFIEYCVQLFGIDADQIQKNIDSVNEYYGERDYYAGTNVIFSHGTQDPWSFLTKKSDPKHWSVVIVEVEGGDHCADLGLSCFHENVTCTENMEQIQTLTLENMQRWIDPVFAVPDRVEISDNVGKRPQFADLNVSPVNMNLPDSVKLRAERSFEIPKESKKLDLSKWNKFSRKFNGLHRLPPVSDSIQQLDAAVQGQDWIVQTWDHFNQNEERTFKQKWFYNYKFGTREGPNFLMIGGEGPESPNWTRNEKEAWMTYAKAVGANAFDLEHRYYGESKLGTNDLQYLTSAQALYDVATFIRTQQVKQNLTGPWITFGGSYPGALAAWSREWFPELILGAVGSSGPVLAKNDYYEYLEVIEDVLQKNSQKCYDSIAEAFDTVHQLAQDPDGRATIQEKFNLWPAWTADPKKTIDPLDMDDFFSALTGFFMGTVQYNPVDNSNVKALCEPFENDTISSLDALSDLRMEHYGPGEISVSFDSDMEYYIAMKNHVDGHDNAYDDDTLSGLLWKWQSCNEFGYWHTTDYGGGIFGTYVPVNYNVIMCERIFGVGMDHIENGVARTNYQYGGRHRYNATNVVLPNGDADPWHALGILEQGNLDESVVPILIKGTSHCADMNPAYAADPPELTQARQTILENIQRWLAHAPPPTPPATTPKAEDPTTTTSIATKRTTTSAKTSTTPTSEVTETPKNEDTTVKTTPATVPVTTSSASSASLILPLILAALSAFM